MISGWLNDRSCQPTVLAMDIIQFSTLVRELGSIPGGTATRIPVSGVESCHKWYSDGGLLRIVYVVSAEEAQQLFFLHRYPLAEESAKLQRMHILVQCAITLMLPSRQEWKLQAR